jgi:hypothetical protein
MKTTRPALLEFLAFGVFSALILMSCTSRISSQSEIATSTPDPSLPRPLVYNGSGSANVTLGPWTGPAILRLSGSGSGSWQAALLNGLDATELAQTGTAADGRIDEYRGMTFGASGQAALKLQGDWTWKAEVLPAAEGYFPVLHVPDTYTGSGSAVVLVKGEYGLAIFRSDDLPKITAWAYGPDGVGEKLSFKLTGDYAGRAVLPEGAGWIVVSGPEAWSLEVQTPCCKAPPGYKPTLAGK